MPTNWDLSLCVCVLTTVFFLKQAGFHMAKIPEVKRYTHFITGGLAVVHSWCVFLKACSFFVLDFFFPPPEVLILIYVSGISQIHPEWRIWQVQSGNYNLDCSLLPSFKMKEGAWRMNKGLKRSRRDSKQLCSAEALKQKQLEAIVLTETVLCKFLLISLQA